jgi:hypothetical protein
MVIYQRASSEKSTIFLGFEKGYHMTTNRKFLTSLAFSAGILTAIAVMPTAGARADELVTNGPQLTAGDRAGSPSAQRNVRDSQRYEALVQTNPSFRANRMQKECGPIADPEMRYDCRASFGQYGSSSRPR